MSEKNEGTNQPAIIVNSQYIKDMSLEIPHAPEIFKEIKEQPELKVDINVETKHLENNEFNVCLNLALNGDVAGKKLFILELSYAAVVTLNVAPEHMEPVLSVEIPRLLFPFARSIVTHSLVEGGLPPLMLTPIDFAAIYNARKAAANNN